VPKHLLWLVPMIAVVATGLAALPYGDGSDTCYWSPWAIEHDFTQDIRIGHHFVPYHSLSCERDGFAMRAGTPLEAALWLLVAVLLVPAFVLRRHPAARAAGEALLVLGVFGLCSAQESWELGAFYALILTPLPVLTAERLSGRDWGGSVVVAVALPFAAIAGWSPGFLADQYLVGVAGAIAASMLVAVLVRRIAPIPLALPPRDLFLRRDP